ncbi:SEL1-like repeat protein [Alsobacter sp. SYSU M60028]|uniref:SEL1-like repeat protein n=1 Tax=Alsobacter ponti TaxID=2962936 RepID=A0ABT1LGJ7_9HYPH|nr:SEL1-like repeat protein [Alsobacter ponti]MCP8939845.1 SEL1-like repeat protein [Alsobacter ponti]
MEHLHLEGADAPVRATRAPDAAPPVGAWDCYELGIMYAAGRDVAVDRVAAHKWLNIAAARGCREAVALRAELAEEMTPAEIAAAQREARMFLFPH